MDTPVYDLLIKYSSSGTLRAHMPGHKGYSAADRLSTLYPLDITEIKGADSLFEANGIIAQGEKNMSGLYGTAATVWSAGGSTLCIQTMLAIMKAEGRRVFAVRNVHRAFLNAAALLDLDVEWILPDYSGGILSGKIDTAAVESQLAQCGTPSCLYITSPDYTGRTADIRALAVICRKYGARLLVDNAHGAHLAFMPENSHPTALGADLCCDSAHKMLPALTGAAMLHTTRTEYAPILKQYMSIFASTSPSYLIMASLDLCNRYISEQIRQDITRALSLIHSFKEHFSGRLSFTEGEPFHITILAAESGRDGTEIAELLRQNGVECEYSDAELVILLMSPLSTAADYEKLTTALDDALSSAQKSASVRRLSIHLPKRAVSVRDAVFSPNEVISVDRAEGRVCGAVNVPCPPAVPIAASGEIIDRECIEIFRAYGIKDINVVKKTHP